MEEYAIVLTAIGGYLLGSIPFGLILSKIFLKTDIRKIGSGSIGATNVSRVNKKLAVITMLLDASKGALAGYLASIAIPYLYDSTLLDIAVMVDYITEYDFMMIGGLFAVLGHNFPVWLKFKGGKGVATTFGLIILLNPMMALYAFLIWITTVLISGYSALGAIVATVSVPFLGYEFLEGYDMVIYGLYILAALSLIRHQSNIRRLIKGQENSFWVKSSSKEKK